MAIYGLEGISQKLTAMGKKANGMKVTVPWPVLPAPSFYLEGPKSESNGQEIADDLKRRHELGVAAVTRGLDAHLDGMMEASWGWIDGARDIVDSGELKSSGTVVRQGDSITVAYSSDYANLVHYGGYIYPYGNVNIEKVYIPARPWVSATLGEAAGPAPAFDWMSVYLDAVNF
jgi:hypothetical protein